MSTQYATIARSSLKSAGLFFPTLHMLPAGMVDNLDDLPHGGAARLKSAERVLATSWHDSVIVPSESAALPPVDAAEPSVAERARRLRQKYRSGLLFTLERCPALSHRERADPLPRSRCPEPGALWSSPLLAHGRSRREHARARKAGASTTRSRGGWVRGDDRGGRGRILFFSKCQDSPVVHDHVPRGRRRRGCREWRARLRWLVRHLGRSDEADEDAAKPTKVEAHPALTCVA
jgi:hypothetical protein